MDMTFVDGNITYYTKSYGRHDATLGILDSFLSDRLPPVLSALSNVDV